MNRRDENIFESVKFIDDVRNKIVNTKDLLDQWRKVADSFVKHKWIYRYTDDSQKEILEKHYKRLCDEETAYDDYKKSFNYIAKFIGIPSNKVIIEDIIFKKDDVDKDQYEICIRYSKGLAKVKIPNGVKLIHVSPVSGINELIPSFRSKTKGKYFYPNKRVFFTISKDIKPNKAGLENSKKNRYTPKNHVEYAYIDPTYCDFKDGAVYIETNRPILVEPFEKHLDFLNMFRREKK